MKKIIFCRFFLLAVLLFAANTISAEVVTLEEGVGAAGPSEGATAEYKFTATRDGVFHIATTFSGAYWGSYSINHQTYNLSNSVFVKEGDVALITVTCEENNTANTIVVTISDVEEGMTFDTAILLNEGNNDIRAMKSGDVPMWYKFNIPASKRGKLTFTGYPTLNAFVGEDLATELGTANPVDYINNSESEQTVFVKISSTNSESLTATLEYLAPIADLTMFNQPVFSIAAGGSLPQGTPVTISFPNRVGGADTDPVTVGYYIFNVAGSAPTGAPVNLGGDTQATGTLAGVDINYNFSRGRKYQIKLQNLHSGNHYAPGVDEQTIVGDAVIFTVVAADTGVEVVETEDATESSVTYNLAGQQVDSNHRGIIITNGKKIIRY